MLHIITLVLLATFVVSPALAAPVQQKEIGQFTGRELLAQQAYNVVARDVEEFFRRDYFDEVDIRDFIYLEERATDPKVIKYLTDMNPEVASNPTWHKGDWMPLHGEGRKSTDGDYHIYTMQGNEPAQKDKKGKVIVPSTPVFIAKVSTGPTVKGLVEARWPANVAAPSAQAIIAQLRLLAV